MKPGPSFGFTRIDRRLVAALLGLALMLGAAALEALRGSTTAASADCPAVAAWRAGESDLWMECSGAVVRLLPDDRSGSRHQRFIVELADGHTLLVSHNIDLAPRVDALAVGDTVLIRGEFEHNDRGGVLHWTHHDPQGRHEGGWIEHEGERYR